MQEDIHILVVEDDEDINRLLCDIVKQAGYQAQPAFSGTEAMIYFEQQSWDVILLDLMLPGKSGEELLASFRKATDAAILIISAKEEQLSKVTMLRSGADDYITKPFDTEEVAARIDAQLRRYERSQRKNHYVHKDIVLDEETKRVHVNDRHVILTAREYHMLKLFLTMPNKLFTKENIFESVWNEPFYHDDNTVNVHISHLRSKLAQANPNEDYIETVWGMGYRLKS